MNDENGHQIKKKAGSQVLRSFSVIGYLVGAMSITSLIVNFGDVALSERVEKTLDYYRDVSRTAKEVLFDWWIGIIIPSISVPIWVIDFLAFWSLSFASLHRLRSRRKTDSPISASYSNAWKSGASFIFAPVLLWAEVGLVSIFSSRLTPMNSPDWSFRRDGRQAIAAMKLAEEHMSRRAYALYVAAFAPIIGSGLFFVWNGLTR